MKKVMCTAVNDTALAAIISVKVVLSSMLVWVTYPRVKMDQVRGSGPTRVATITMGVSRRQMRSCDSGNVMAVRRWRRMNAVTMFSAWKRWLEHGANHETLPSSSLDILPTYKFRNQLTDSTASL